MAEKTNTISRRAADAARNKMKVSLTQEQEGVVITQWYYTILLPSVQPVEDGLVHGITDIIARDREQTQHLVKYVRRISIAFRMGSRCFTFLAA